MPEGLTSTPRRRPVHRPGRGGRCGTSTATSSSSTGWDCGRSPSVMAIEPWSRPSRAEMAHGCNFTRPVAIGTACAEAFLDIVPGADMVKFAKNGSDATTAAVKLARAIHRPGPRRDLRRPSLLLHRRLVHRHDDDDGRHPGAEHESSTVEFRYNDLDSREARFSTEHPGGSPAVILEAGDRDRRAGARFLEGCGSCADEHGAVLIFDEMITGIRWNVRWRQRVYGVTPDLSTFGKAIGNGFALSALAASATDGAGGLRPTRAGLPASTHTAPRRPPWPRPCNEDKRSSPEPVVEHLIARGELRRRGGVRAVAERHDLADYVT